MKKKKEELNKLDNLFLLAQKKLSISNVSTSKMKEYLKKKGGSKKEIEEVIYKLRKYSFLDEDGLIKDVISYCDAKHYGYNKIISMLKQKEIDIAKINKISKNEVRELRESRQMLNSLKKRYKNKSTVNLKRSIYSALIRYGFDENIASMRVSEVFNSYQEELNVLKLDYSKLLSSYSKKLKGRKLKEKIKDTLVNKGYKLNDIRKVDNYNYEMD